MKMLVKEYCQSSKFSGKKRQRGREGGEKGLQDPGRRACPSCESWHLKATASRGTSFAVSFAGRSAKYKGTAVFGMNACAHAACPGWCPSFRGHRPPRLLLCTPLTPVSRTPEPLLHFEVKDSRASKDTVIPGLGFRKALCLRRFSELAVPTSRDGDRLQRLQQEGQTG